MKIRSIKCYHKIFSPPISINFSNDNESLNGMFCIHGSPNSGKSLILHTLASRWSHHALSNEDVHESPAMIDMECDMDRLGILSISRTQSPSFNRNKVREHSKITESAIYGSILYYPIDRCFLSEESLFKNGSAASNIFTIYSDIRARKIQNSVIIIDDMDFKMSQNDFTSFYRFLSDFSKNNNNQIITTISNIENSSLFEHNKRIEIKTDNNIISDIVENRVNIHGN